VRSSTETANDGVLDTEGVDGVGDGSTGRGGSAIDGSNTGEVDIDASFCVNTAANATAESLVDDGCIAGGAESGRNAALAAGFCGAKEDDSECGVDGGRIGDFLRGGILTRRAFPCGASNFTSDSELDTISDGEVPAVRNSDVDDPQSTESEGDIGSDEIDKLSVPVCTDWRFAKESDRSTNCHRSA